MFNSKYKKFISCWKRIAETEDGKEVLSYLREEEMFSRCFHSDPCKTAYLLGRQELAKELVSTADYLKLDEIDIKQTTKLEIIQ